MKVVLFIVLATLACSFALNVGDNACISAGLNLRTSPCGSVVKTSTGSESGKVLNVIKKSCSFGTYTWVQVHTPNNGKVWGALETNLMSKCSPGGGGGKKKDHNVPQVHQIWDTPDNFGGGWACGPTSAVMAAAYYKKLAPKPITVSYPHRHTNNYGWYVSNKYKSPSGVVLSRGQKDSRGNIAYGAYGTCTDGGLGWAWRIQEFFKHHNLKSKFHDVASPQAVIRALDQGHLIVLSTKLTSGGHLILIRGYENGGKTFIANDPNGDASKPGYGKSLNGEGARYSWAQMKTKYMVEVWA